ncbi:hypothetical protein DL93DRAFT_1511740 [Clavulina sp. PMI_390]|nr:hypothetical protein DL93DRAFT_1511740 [Clavulina sp. PMI_390]
MIPSGVALRLVNLFQNLELFNSPYDPRTSTEAPERFEGYRSKSLFTLYCLLYFRAPSTSAASHSPLSREVHENILRFAILSRRPVLPDIRDNAIRVLGLKSVLDLLRISSTIFSYAMDGIMSLPPAQAHPITFSQVSGLTPTMLMEQSLDIADACSGNQKALEYKMVARMITGGDLDEMNHGSSPLRFNKENKCPIRMSYCHSCTSAGLFSRLAGRQIYWKKLWWEVLSS